MRIVHLAPLIKPLTPKAPGGAEQVVLDLAQYQSERGDDVSIIAAVGSEIPCGIRSVDLALKADVLIPVQTSGETKESAREKVLAKEREVFPAVVRYLRQNSDKIDLIHNHAYDCFPLFELNKIGLPLVQTLHLPPLVPWIVERIRTLETVPEHVKYIAVSAWQAQSYRRETGLLPTVIRNGIDLREVRFVDSAQDHFLWVGRISPEKGLHLAIEHVVKRAKRKLVVVGRVYDQEYYQEEIKHRLEHPLVSYRGHISRRDVLEEMGRACALVLPISWDEPFGLVFIEALACGTPVITFRRGAAPEIIRDGENGFLVEKEEDLGLCLERVAGIERKDCRAIVEESFSIERMAADYYQQYIPLVV